MPPRCRTNIVRKSQKDLTLFENYAMRTVPADHPLFGRLHKLAQRGYLHQQKNGQTYTFMLTGRGRYALTNVMIAQQLAAQ